MNWDQLRKLAKSNEVALNDYGGRKRTPPFYFDSLRHAFGYYFNTFNTQNASYEIYASSSAKEDISILKSQLLDEDNTMLSLISFERFFEIFFKNILSNSNKKLAFQFKSDPQLKSFNIIEKIRDPRTEIKKYDKVSLSINFRETIKRLYELIDLEKSGFSDPIILKFKKVYSKFNFIDSNEIKNSLHVLSWYRDRILHNGNRLPTLWFLDYLITQRIVPIVKGIIDADRDSLGESIFYFQTVTKINVLNKLSEIKFEFKDLKNVNKSEEMFNTLLYIGHLKEIGRASLNMNLFVRNNSRATYEYNYYDPVGRAKRFAQVERGAASFLAIKKCPCCGEETLVLYRMTVPSFFKNQSTEFIDWIKCYLCDYHIRRSVGDPNQFGLSKESVFI